jgi:hypothetical protein
VDKAIWNTQKQKRKKTVLEIPFFPGAYKITGGFSFFFSLHSYINT